MSQEKVLTVLNLLSEEHDYESYADESCEDWEPIEVTR